MYYKLVAKVKNISISGFVLKTKCDKEKSNFEKEIHDTSGLVKETDYNAKITEIENKIAISSCVATNAALTAVEKNPDVSSLVKKKQKDYNANICEIEKKLTYYNHNKYITTPEFNKFTAEIFSARLAQANLITKTDFDTKLILILINYALIEIELKKLQTFDSIFLETKVVSKKMAHKMI